MQTSTLIVSVDFPPHKDGVSTVSGELAEKLTRLGKKIVVVGPYEKGVKDFDRKLPFKVYRTPFYNLGYIRFIPIAIITSFLLLKYKVNAVFSMNIAYSGICSFFLSKIFRFKYISFAYGYEFRKVKNNPILRNLYLKIYRDSKAIFAISNYVLQKLIEFGVDSQKIKLVHPGTDPDKFYPSKVSDSDYRRYNISENSKVILTVGRLVERKGHDMVIKAMPYIIAKFPNALYFIAGDGPQRKKLERLTNDLKVSKYIRFLGKVSDRELLKLYNMCSLFIMPSREIKNQGQVEGFGIVYLEANACSKPVIASCSGGIEDCVIDGYNGIIINPLDLEDIKNVTIKLLEDKELREKLGAQGRQRVLDEFNWSNFVNSVFDIVYN